MRVNRDDKFWIWKIDFKIDCACIFVYRQKFCIFIVYLRYTIHDIFVYRVYNSDTSITMNEERYDHQASASVLSSINILNKLLSNKLLPKGLWPVICAF